MGDVFYKFHIQNNTVYGAKIKLPTVASPNDKIVLCEIHSDCSIYDYWKKIGYPQWYSKNVSSLELFQQINQQILKNESPYCHLIDDEYLKVTFMKTLNYFQHNQKELFSARSSDSLFTENEFLDEFKTKLTIDGHAIYPVSELTSKFLLRHVTGLLVPRKNKFIFFMFNSIHGYDDLTKKSLIMLRKLFRYVITNICPFVIVCDIEGNDNSYYVAKQFYTIDDKLELSMFQMKNQQIYPSTHFYITNIIRDSNRNIKEIKCKSVKTKMIYRVNIANKLLNKIGILGNYHKSIALPKTLNHLKRKHPENCDSFSSLIVIKESDYYFIMDTVLCNVIYKLKTKNELLKRSQKIIKMGFDIAFYETDRIHLNQKIIDMLTGVAISNRYLEKVLRFIASMWSPNFKNRMFKNGALVGFSEEIDRNTYEWMDVICLDFIKFYPHILLLLNTRQTFSKVVRYMLDLTAFVPSVKQDLVSLIGQLTFYDDRLFHAIKSCAVAIMFNLQSSNPNLKIIGYSTDSIFIQSFDSTHQISLSSPHFDLDVNSVLPIKIENQFKKIIFMNSINKYIGILKNNKLIIKGYSSKNTKPSAEMKLIECLAESLLSVDLPLMECSQLIKNVIMNLQNCVDYMIVSDLIFPSNKENSKNKYHPEVYFQTNFCQDRFLVYHDTNKTLKSLGFDEHLVLSSISAWYETHQQESRICFCNNCSAERTIQRLGPKLTIGCCFGIDYKQYAFEWLIIFEHLINDFLKFSSLYNDEQITDYLENKKMLHLKLMGSVEDVILKWSDVSTTNTGFVPLAGLLQCN